MEFLTDGILALTWQQIVMFAVGITLIWLAIKKGFEPALLLPMGFGAILVNLPFSGVLNRQTESLNGCSMWELKPQKSCRFYFSSELAL